MNVDAELLTVPVFHDFGPSKPLFCGNKFILGYDAGSDLIVREGGGHLEDVTVSFESSDEELALSSGVGSVLSLSPQHTRRINSQLILLIFSKNSRYNLSDFSPTLA